MTTATTVSLYPPRNLITAFDASGGTAVPEVIKARHLSNLAIHETEPRVFQSRTRECC